MNQIPNPLPKITFATSLTIKVGLIVLLTLLLQIPLWQIQSVIYERQERSQNTIDEIQKSWAPAQTLRLPILAVPSKKKDKKTEALTTYFLPHSLNFDVSLEPQERYRGIYKTVVYTSHVVAKGTFALPIDDHPQLKWDEAKLLLALSDLKGLIRTPTIQFGDQSLEIHPGTQSRLFTSGLHAPIDLSSAGKRLASMPFSIQLDVKGSAQLHLLPLGAETRAAFQSSWPDPSFSGDFLPESRVVSAQGFESSWQVPALARGFPQVFDDSQRESVRTAMQSSRLGVSLLQPMTHYKQTSRAIKYGSLFIIFTFIAFFLFELNHRTPVHILQYALVGVSLSTFFLILLAFSEHLAFGWSYLLASFAVIAQIALYTYQTLRSAKASVVLSGVLLGLYSYLYMTMRIEDYALFVGSISLFIAVSAVMYFTRNIQWQALSNPFETEPDPVKA